ncbi:hypothetical protein RB653_004612 [Dictyostelium firmibasis]|uniref:AB hydrolase-1 domain-containing protein n=1 Tax=Dictyostelium firmibasis TaxID=79012 RepID=A0AAN7U1A6_9MYCE
MFRNIILNISKNNNRYYCSSKINSGKAVDLKFITRSPTSNAVINSSNEIKNIVLLHGLFGSGNNWNKISKLLADKTNCKIFQVDQRNHGQSPHSDEFSYRSMSDDLDQFINKQSIEDLCIIGHSMGGRTAMLYSLLNPTKVKKLIVVDISPRQSTSHRHNLEFRNILLRMKSMDLSKTKKRTDANDWLLPVVEDNNVRSFLLTNLACDEDGNYFWRINIDALLENIDKIDSFPSDSEIKSIKNSTSPIEFTKDTLFIKGGLSNFIQNEDFPKMRQLFPNYELNVFEGFEHWLHSDDPLKFVEVSSDFINRE